MVRRTLFTPDIILPHLHRFQSLDRVHTLIIERYHAPLWANHYKTCFAHLYPTLTSLTLRRPFGHYRLLLQFALQFPHLENLSLDFLEAERAVTPGLVVPTVVDQSSPLRGCLRLAGYGTAIQLPSDFTREFPKGIKFRSVELEDFLGNHAQHTLEACADTLESLTIVPLATGTRQFLTL
jgi:hypothetical protein